MNFAYLRCSTNETRQDITRQANELKEFGIDVFYYEYEHGDASIKKELNKLFDKAREGDALYTTEISRLARSVKQFIDVLEKIKEKRMKLVIANSITVDCAKGTIDPMTNAFLQMGALFAELELNITRERVRSGLRNASAKGVKLGRPEITKEDLPTLFLRHYPAYKTKQLNVSEFARVCNVSRPTIYKYIEIAESK